jgi:hypothetical protein
LKIIFLHGEIFEFPYFFFRRLIEGKNLEVQKPEEIRLGKY